MEKFSTQVIQVHLRNQLSQLTSKKALKKLNADIKSLSKSSISVYPILVGLLIQSIESYTPDDLRLVLLSSVLVLSLADQTFLSNFSKQIEEVVKDKKISSIDFIEILVEKLKLGSNDQVILAFILALNENNENLDYFHIKAKTLYEKNETLNCNKEVQSQIMNFMENHQSIFSQEIFNYFESFQYEDSKLAEEFDVKLKKLDEYLTPADLILDLKVIADFKKVFKLFQSYSEEQILEFIIILSNEYPFLEDILQRNISSLALNNIATESDSDRRTIQFNIDQLIIELVELHPQIKFLSILKKLDSVSLPIKDQKSLLQLLKFFQRVRKYQNFLFPSSLLFCKWKNSILQTRFLFLLIQLGQPELVNFNEMQKRITNLDFNPNFRYSTLAPQLQFLACLEMLELLIELSESDETNSIRLIFEFPITKCPDVLIMGLAQIKPKQGLGLMEELLSKLFPMYLLNHSNSVPILEALWKYNEKLMIEAIYELCSRENSSLNLSRVLDITQEIKDSLIPLVDCDKLEFSISLGILASKREFLHFEHWFCKRLRKDGNIFIEALLKYIEENLIIPCVSMETQFGSCNVNMNYQLEAQAKLVLEKSQLSLESLGIIMENLLAIYYDQLNMKIKIRAKDIYQNICRFFPALASATESAKLEVENVAESFFQKVYSESMKVEEFIDNLNKIKSSINPFEREVYACVLHHLFDEFRHHESYNMKYIKITGQLYGECVNSRMLDGTPLLNLALNCMRFSLEKNSLKRIEFAKVALKILRKRFSELFDFFQMLFSIENIKEKITDILLLIYQDSLKYDKLLIIRPDILQFLISQNQPKQKMIQKPAKQETITLESVLKQDIDGSQVEEHLKTKLIFFLNNLTTENVNVKTNEISQLLINDLAEEWFSKTLVYKRIIHETNKSQYIALLAGISRKTLYSKIISHTYALISKLFTVNVDASESQLKNILKNLGSWLGAITLSRNKPIIMKFLNVKALLIEGFNSGKLGIFLPFICKTLEAAKQSEVFHERNPWLKSILQLLREIYRSEDIKTNQKCEIQLLFKNLSLEIENATEEIEIPSLSLLSLPESLPPNTLSSLQLVFSQNIKEILKPIVARSVQSALMASKYLTIKDFIFEQDDKKFARALKSIVQKLAGSMALTNSREQLLNILSKSFFDEISKSEQSFRQNILNKTKNNSNDPHEKVEKVVSSERNDQVREKGLLKEKTGDEGGWRSDKFDLRKGLKEKYSEEPIKQKSIEEKKIEVNAGEEVKMESWMRFFENKEKMAYNIALENIDSACAMIQQAAVDSAMKEIRMDKELMDRRKGEEEFRTSFERIPEKLRPNQNGLSSNELEIYEDFNDKVGVLDKQLELLCDSLNYGEEPKKVMDRGIMMMKNPEFCEKVLRRYFSKNEHQEFFFELIKKKISVSEKNMKEAQILSLEQKKSSEKIVKHSILSLTEEILNERNCFNESKIVPLFLAGLISSSDLDEIFTLLIKKNPSISVQLCVVKTLKILIFQKQALKEICLLSLVALGNLMGCGAIQEVVEFMEEINKYANFGREHENWLNFNENDEKIRGLFIKWVNNSEEETKNIILKEIEKNKKKMVASLLSFVISEALQSIINTSKVGVIDMDYTYLDSFYQLISHPFLSSPQLLSELLSILVLLFKNSHDKYSINFNGRPFYRFTFLLLNSIKNPIFPINIDSLTQILTKNLFLIVSPVNYPGFSACWLELMGQMLNLLLSIKGEKSLMLALLLEALKFLQFFDSNEDCWKLVDLQKFYKGVTKIFLILLHDFPEFLSFYFIPFCEKIPLKGIQLRNMILSAFPKNLKLPDPFNLNFEDSSIREMFCCFPEIYAEGFEKLHAELNIQTDVIEYFGNKSDAILLKILQKLLSIPSNMTFPMVQSFVLSIPWLIYKVLKTNSNNEKQRLVEDSQILLKKTIKFENLKLRDCLFNAVLNQIRFPSILTYYFLTLTVSVLKENGFEQGQQHLSQLIFERLIVEKPHPWGLVILILEVARDQNWKKKVFAENQALFELVMQNIFKSIQN